jgi:hypothetical protein
MRRTWVALVCATVVTATIAGTQSGAVGAGEGTQAWDVREHVGQVSAGNDIALSPDGATTYTTGYAQESLVVVARDAVTGATRWTSSSDPQPGESASGERVATSPDGSRVYVVAYGICESCTSPPSWVVEALDASTGEREWVSRVANPGTPYSLIVSADGSTLVANGDYSGDGDSLTIAMDAATGSVRWRDTAGAGAWGGRGLALGSEGTVYALSSSYGTSACGGARTFQTVLKRYDLTTGAQQQVLDSTLCGYVRSIATTPDGSTLMVVGTSSGYYSPLKITAIDTATRAVRWTRVEDSGQNVAADTSPDVTTSPDGATAFVASSTYPQDYAHDPLAPAMTRAYDVSTGNLRWVARYDGEGDAGAGSLEVSPDGSRVFVAAGEQRRCGRVCGPEDGAGLVLAYDAATGAQAWVARYPGGIVRAVTSSADGSRVYLVGRLVAQSSTAPARAACTGDRCGMATAAYNDDADAYRAEDSDVAVRWSGWTGRFDARAVGGADRSSRVRGAQASYVSPSSTSVSWVTRVGPDMGKAQVMVDGRTRGIWDLYAPRSARKVVTVGGLAKKAHRMQVVVTGTKRAASTGTKVVTDGFATALTRNLQADYDMPVRLGSWQTVERPAASGGTVRASDRAGAEGSMTFRGSRLRVLTATGPNLGRMRVTIDGVSRVVDLYSASRHSRVPVSFTGLGPGRHKVTVSPVGRKDRRSTGTTVLVDAFVVRP